MEMVNVELAPFWDLFSQGDFDELTIKHMMMNLQRLQLWSSLLGNKVTKMTFQRRECTMRFICQMQDVSLQRS